MVTTCSPKVMLIPLKYPLTSIPPSSIILTSLMVSVEFQASSAGPRGEANSLKKSRLPSALDLDTKQEPS